MGKNREGLVSKCPCSQNTVHPHSWALCSASGFESEHFAFCKHALIFAYLPLWVAGILSERVLAKVWKANIKNRCEGKGVYVWRGCCMKFMLSKELGCSSQEEPQGAGSFWKFGSRDHSNIKKKEAYFLLCFIFITDSMGNTFRPIWTVSLALYPPQFLHFLLPPKDLSHQQEFFHWWQLGSGLDFPFWTFRCSLPGEIDCVKFSVKSGI